MSDTLKAGDDVEALIERVLELDATEERAGARFPMNDFELRTAAPALRSVLEELERVKKERDESDRALVNLFNESVVLDEYATLEKFRPCVAAAHKRQEASNG